MDMKEVFKKIGKGMCTRRAASLLAHGKDYKGYLRGLKDFSPATRDDMQRKAEIIGEKIRRRPVQAPKPKGR
jgi:hypothetical protein